MKKEMMYRGRFLKDYSKEELIEIVQFMYEMYEARIADLRGGLRIGSLKKSW